MSLEKSKIVPTAFWVGFLALGFVTSIGGPNKHRVIDQAVARPARTTVAPEDLVAQTEPQTIGVAARPARIGAGSR